MRPLRRSIGGQRIPKSQVYEAGVHIIAGAEMRPYDHSQVQQSGTGVEPENRRYPTRERKKLSHLDDFVDEYSDSDGARMTMDYCYRAVCEVPQTYAEAMRSTNSKEWVKAMDEEVQSLNDNKTFTVTTLPVGKKTVGGKWVYSIQSHVNGRDNYKACFVSKGYSQVKGINSLKHFS